MSVTSLVGGARAWSVASGGKVTAINNLTTTVQTVVQANQNRLKIIFHNPGTVDVLVAPVVLGNGQTLVPTTAAKGGGFLVYGNGGTLMVEGECQGAWQALAVSGTDNPLTIMDSNI